MPKPDDSHIDEMREALRGDRERSRRSSVVSQQLSGDDKPDDQPAAETAAAERSPAPKRRRFWRS
jgi:hypothetical protein